MHSVRKSVRVTAQPSDDDDELEAFRQASAAPPNPSFAGMRAVRKSIRVDFVPPAEDEDDEPPGPLRSEASSSFRAPSSSSASGSGSAARVSSRPSSNLNVRKSVRVDYTQLAELQAVKEAANGAAADEDAEYKQVITLAQKCLGHGAMEGAFPEEWDAQLLVDCGRSASGHRLVIFCPTFLNPLLNDQEEIDRAFRFLLLSMDSIAMNEKYDFVYCYLGMDWSNPKLAQRLRQAYDILPRKYAKHLRHFYILHPNSVCRATLWTFWAWLSKRLWDKIVYVDTLDQLCEMLQPEDLDARAELRRRFPQMVQRNDQELRGVMPMHTYGVPLKQLCSTVGVDYTDKTTGRWYPKLPPALIFLCEAMEREAADEDFCHLFDAEANAVYSLVDTIDQGKPLGRDMPMGALWCALKLFLDCLPQPLLTFQALEELQRRNVKPGEMQAQRRFLIDVFHSNIPPESAYVALYLSSFLHTMCETAQERSALPSPKLGHEPGKDYAVLTPALAAKVFTPAFLRPRVMSEASPAVLRSAMAVIETLVQCAEEPEIWIGGLKPVLAAPQASAESSDSSSSSSSDGEDDRDERSDG